MRALIVDTDRERGDYTRDVLNNIGIVTVRVARNSDKAIDFLHSGPSDIAIVDFGSAAQVHMKFMVTLRSPDQTPAPNLPVLAILPKATRTEVQSVIRAGADHVIVRPFSGQELQARLEVVNSTLVPRYESENYVGPDRRRIPVPGYVGPDRRGG